MQLPTVPRTNLDQYIGRVIGKSDGWPSQDLDSTILPSVAAYKLVSKLDYRFGLLRQKDYLYSLSVFLVPDVFSSQDLL